MRKAITALLVFFFVITPIYIMTVKQDNDILGFDFFAYLEYNSSVDEQWTDLLETLADIWSNDDYIQGDDSGILEGFLNSNFAEVVLGTAQKILDTFIEVGEFLVGLLSLVSIVTPWAYVKNIGGDIYQW